MSMLLPNYVIMGGDFNFPYLCILHMCTCAQFELWMHKMCNIACTKCANAPVQNVYEPPLAKIPARMC